MGSDLGELLRRLRRERGVSKQRLSDAADVSTTYISQIESGVDPRTRKAFQPSPGVLRRLAAALAGGDPKEARRLYEALLAAAGYLPGEIGEDVPFPLPPAMPEAVQAPPPSIRDEERARGGRGEPSSRAGFRAESALPSALAVPDRRPRGECLAILEGWGQLDEAERDAFLAVVRLIATRHGWAAERQGERE